MVRPSYRRFISNLALIGQVVSEKGHDLYKLCRSRASPLMLLAKFQNHRPSDSGEDFLNVFAIYSHGGHLGHVTWTIYINYRSLFLRMLYMKFGFDSPTGFREEDL